jgi:branched-chain amino acid aminotransferase
MSAAMPTLTIQRARVSRSAGVAEAPQIAFSSVFSDHMLVATFRAGRWQDAVIREYGELSLPPNISSLQYGLSVFEGLKAHRTIDGRVALFRPSANAARLNRSAARLAMPEVPEDLFLRGLRELVTLDRDWVPPPDRGALYVRPCLFSIDPSVRVKAPEECLFVIFTFPFTNYYKGPVDLMASEQYVRAFPGGTGDVKPAGNYAPTLVAERAAQQAGLHSVLWLDGIERAYVEECGVMNVFFVIDGTVVTPPPGGTILPGITRDSALTVLRDLGMRVVERPIALEEVFTTHRAATLTECFGTGTAATVSHVRRIRYRSREIELPPPREYSVGAVLRERLLAIATGRFPDRHGWLDVL